MTARRSLMTMLLLAGIGTSLSPAAAEPLPAHAMFRDMFFEGCMPAMVRGASVEAYARGAQMSGAPPEWVTELIDKDPGKVYMRPDPYNPMFIVEYSAGKCEVAARSPPDLPGLIAVMEEILLAPDSPFKRFIPRNNKPTKTEVWRDFQGKIDGRNFGVILLTDSAKDAPAQARAMLYTW